MNFSRREYYRDNWPKHFSEENIRERLDAELAQAASRIAADVKRIGTNQDTPYGVNTRIKKYFSHVVIGC